MTQMDHRCARETLCDAGELSLSLNLTPCIVLLVMWFCHESAEF